MNGPFINRRLDRWNRRDFLFFGGGLMGCTSVLTSCKPPKTKISRKTTPLGERAEVGSLVFLALETKWSTQFGEMPRIRVPKNQFLSIRISITNQGGGTVGCPLLSLVDEADNRFPEVDDAKEVDGWLGLIRMIQAGNTEFGWIVFDVPPSNYALRLSDGNVENEKIGYVDLPLRLDS